MKPDLQQTREAHVLYVLQQRRIARFFIGSLLILLCLFLYLLTLTPPSDF